MEDDQKRQVKEKTTSKKNILIWLWHNTTKLIQSMDMFRKIINLYPLVFKFFFISTLEYISLWIPPPHIFMLHWLVTWLWHLCVFIRWDTSKFWVVLTDTPSWDIHVYRPCPCFTCLWVLRCPFCVVWYSHWLHEYICEPS